jgi:hypothetical protein
MAKPAVALNQAHEESNGIRRWQQVRTTAKNQKGAIRETD